MDSARPWRPAEGPLDKADAALHGGDVDRVRFSGDSEDLTVLASNALEELADRLAADLAAHPPPGLFDEACVVVPSPGLGSWLQQHLARRLGIVMGIRFLLPGRALAELAAALGCPSVVEAAVFHDPERAVWRVYAALEGSLGDRAADDALARWQLARRLTDAFDRYLVARPDVLLAWDRGDLEGEDEVVRWQAGLWRSAFAPPSGPPPLVRALGGAACGADAAALPHRVHLFGTGVLAPLHFEVLRRVSRAVPVRIYQLQPTDTYWGDAALGRKARKRAEGAAHPLLQSFGRLVCDAQELLAEAQQEDVPFRRPAAPTLLAHVQRSLLEHPFEPEGGFPRVAVEPADRSLRVHACHSRLRELEVVRQEVLAFLAENPSARPADVLVLAPDIERYAPLVPVVFGDPDRTPRLPWQLVDRRSTIALPGARAFLALVELAGGRLPASGLANLLENPSVATAVGLSAEEVSRVRPWLRACGLHWGVDARSRSEMGLSETDAGTWAAARRALLLGTVMRRQDDLPFAGVLPHPDAGEDPACAVRLVESLDRIVDQVQALRQPRSLQSWAASLRAAAALLLAPEDAAWDVVAPALEKLLGAEIHSPVPREVVAAWLQEALDQRSGPAPFPGSGILFCALQPLRAVPARAIFVVGLDADAFPRHPGRPSFDLLARAPRRGDRSPREDDRLLFLETILSARDRLHFTYVGRSASDNLPLAPSAALEEFLRILERLAVVPGDGELREVLVVEHRLHGFHPAYFEGSPELLQHDVGDAAAAAALRSPAVPPAPFFAIPVEDSLEAGAPRSPSSPGDASGDEEIALEDLKLLLEHPTRFHLRHALGLHWPPREGQVEDTLFSEKPELRRYRLEMWYADCLLRGVEPILERAVALDLVVPGKLGLTQLQEAAASAIAVTRILESVPDLGAAPHEIRAQVEPAVFVCGLLRPVHYTGSGLRILRYLASSRGQSRAIGPWLEHLLLCAWGEACVEPGYVGFRKGEKLALQPVDAAEARRRLALVVSLARRARRAPIPLDPIAAEAASRRLMDKPEDHLGAIDWARRRLAAPRGDRVARLEEPEMALAWRGRDPCGEGFLELVRSAWVPLFFGMAGVDEDSKV